ncbi:MAG: glycine cleavage system protein GcvH [Muribaculaceae bacterium]|nr:glycine cleavage system protein GcvH [Muribaculaceae bacterium]MDE6351765.1 glycine cleavage system protein GcvH [Muribaculaceae bacterium]MDE6642798.1 glycine cleavage system protein GcvH [Muribaculaceae bacterium]MDE7091963.1 glycine cleavage system protein GcvH [Muribaculaceae bacterium]
MKIYYAPSHEYIKVDGNVGYVGITDYAQKALGNVVYVDMPEVGDEVEAGEDFGAIESVKAASDLIAPASGEVIEVNEALADNPRLVNEDAMNNWIIKIQLSDPAELDNLLDEAAYAKVCEAEH